MKCKIILCLFLIPMWMSAQNALNILENGGASTNYLLSNIESHTFSAGKMITEYKDDTPNLEINLTDIDELTFVTDNALSIGEETLEDTQQLTAYPIPVTSDLTVVYDTNQFGTVELEIVTISGQVVISKQLDKTVGTNRYKVALQQLPAGMYILRLTGITNQVIKKIIKN